MHRCQRAAVSSRSRSWLFLGATSLALALPAAACGNVDDDSSPGGAVGRAGAGGGSAGSTGRAGSSGAAGDRAVSVAAGAGGQGGEGASAGATESEGGSAGAAGAPVVVASCAAGGPVFVVGNYANATGDELLLRASPSAATIAFVPKAPAVLAKPPQLFAVDRFCSSNGAFIATDGAAHYRVDFVQSGSQVALCMSAAASTVELAASLAPADLTHQSDTGCAGKPFRVFAAEVK